MALYIFQAEQFIDETGIDALAVCIGNVHGKYPPSGPNLRLDLLKVSFDHAFYTHIFVVCSHPSFAYGLTSYFGGVKS